MEGGSTDCYGEVAIMAIGRHTDTDGASADVDRKGIQESRGQTP